MAALRSKYAWMLWAVALVALTVVIYRPGLAGGFLFDDMANLPALGRYGPIVDLPSLLRYLTSGIADPSGRPLAMLSFLIDANDWPAEAWPFKRTNLAILFKARTRFRLAADCPRGRPWGSSQPSNVSAGSSTEPDQAQTYMRKDARAPFVPVAAKSRCRITSLPAGLR